MLIDDLKDTLKVWWRSDMIWLKTLSEGLGGHWGFLIGGLEDVSGSWLDTWRIVPSSTLKMLRGLSWKFDQDQTWYGWESLSGGLGRPWRFLIGDLEDGVTFDIKGHVGGWLWGCLEGLMKIWHDWLRKSYSPVDIIVSPHMHFSLGKYLKKCCGCF